MHRFFESSRNEAQLEVLEAFFQKCRYCSVFSGAFGKTPLKPRAITASIAQFLAALLEKRRYRSSRPTAASDPSKICTAEDQKKKDDEDLLDSEIEEMAVNQTAALKVGLCLLGLCLFGYIVGPPLYWHFMEGLVAFSYTSNTCPPCLCDYSSQPLLTIPEEVCEKKISFSLTFYLDLNKLIKRLWSVCKMKVLTPHKLKKSKTKPMKHLKHTNMVRLFTKAADSAKKGMLEFTVRDSKTFCLNRSCFDLLWIPVVDFGETGPVRCSRCKGYINHFIKFIDQERKFICNLCGEFEDGYLDDDGTQELEKYSDDNKELAWMFLLDGCAILQAVYMRYGNDDNDGKMFIKNDLLTFVYLDQFLLENQLPFRVLELLTSQRENGEKIHECNPKVHRRYCYQHRRGQGILCIGFLKRSRQQKEITREQAIQDLEELERRREELEQLLLAERV
ncbi:hypothetical protein PVK06_040488 [Gossypium arboreum]|uniref:Zinc finger Sec23/Sec24-type domain-containing protein n=1 Tax=Gossypium arboreum TaxID=29729 RepID=A0ABR0N6B5_GOSAR|nr:hypothetical protein PVK06_040488 [Gossypium arboreum]